MISFKRSVSKNIFSILLFTSLLFLSFTNRSKVSINQPLNLSALQNIGLLRASLPPTISKQTVTISTKEAKKILRKVKRNKAYLIDVRTPEEFVSKHLQYAQNINYKSSDFIQKMQVLDQSKPMYLYCRSGHRSGNAADTLKTLGYKLVYSIGALDSLYKVGLPIRKN